MPTHPRPCSGPVAATLLALLLAACAGGPRLATGPDANPSAARGLLVSAATQGPVPLEIDSPPPAYAGGATEVAQVAGQAVSWLQARLEPAPLGSVPRDRRRLVFRFEDVAADAAAVCAGDAAVGAVPAGENSLYAVFCDGQRPVADVRGTAEGSDQEDTDRLIRATMARMFPGADSQGGYGFGYPGVSLGVGIGSGGGWGLGGGLRF